MMNKKLIFIVMLLFILNSCNREYFEVKESIEITYVNGDKEILHINRLRDYPAKLSQGGCLYIFRPARPTNNIRCGVRSFIIKSNTE